MDATGLYRSRARRFTVAVPAKVCSEAEPRGLPALTKNVSTTGALLVDSQAVPVGSELKVWLLMRNVRSSLADVVCPAVVVRCERDEPEGAFGVGVKFKNYEFRRPER